MDSGARLTCEKGGRAFVCVGCDLGYGDLPCVGLSRLREVIVELTFRKEQQALARAAILGRDLPRDSGGSSPADLQDAIASRAGYAQRQGVRALLIHKYSHPLTSPWAASIATFTFISGGLASHRTTTRACLSSDAHIVVRVTVTKTGGARSWVQ